MHHLFGCARWGGNANTAHTCGTKEMTGRCSRQGCIISLVPPPPSSTCHPAHLRAHGRRHGMALECMCVCLSAMIIREERRDERRDGTRGEEREEVKGERREGRGDERTACAPSLPCVSSSRQRQAKPRQAKPRLLRPAVLAELLQGHLRNQIDDAKAEQTGLHHLIDTAFCLVALRQASQRNQRDGM